MISGREIAFPIEACVTMLLECGMQEEVGPATADPSPQQMLAPGPRFSSRPQLPTDPDTSWCGTAPHPIAHMSVLLSL